MPFRFFKNVSLFCFQQPTTLTAETLQTHLAHFPSRPCGELEWFTLGWVSPLTQTDTLIYEANHCLLLTLRRQEKILPPATIRDFMQEKLARLESDLARKARKFEREAIKDQVIRELLPQALPRHIETSAYIDTRQNWLVINTASQKRAEELVNFLRESVGSLPVVAPRFQQSPSQIMTQWLRSQTLPTALTLGEDCHLTTRDGESIIYRHTDLSAPAVQAHLTGKIVHHLGLQWAERLAFTLDNDLVIKRLKYLETELESGEDVYADFSLMTSAFTQLITQLFAVFERQF